MKQDSKANECIVLQQDPDAIIPDGYECWCAIRIDHPARIALTTHAQVISQFYQRV